jgi:type I restriction enzyme, S subunit
LASEWRTATVGDVAVRVTKGTTPTTIGGRFVGHGINFVKVESITEDGRLDAEKLAHIDATTNDLLARSVLCADDVLFTIAGTIGRVALVPSSALPANTNQAVAIVRPDQDAVDPRFLYYALRDRSRLQQANARVVQSVQANFSLAELRTLEIPLPDIAEQRAIAHILGTLDDKIELSRQMNETLEAIARALFKSWFVDFDPVRAKSEGRDPGMPRHLADLFPVSFEDSALGEIPKGWRVGKLGDVLAQRVERCVPSPETEARPYVPIDCISSKSLSLTESKPGKEAQSSLTKFYKGDLLFGAMRPYFHKVCIAPFDGTTRTTAFVLFPRAIESSHSPRFCSTIRRRSATRRGIPLAALFRTRCGLGRWMACPLSFRLRLLAWHSIESSFPY